MRNPSEVTYRKIIPELWKLLKIQTKMLGKNVQLGHEIDQLNECDGNHFKLNNYY